MMTLLKHEQASMSCLVMKITECNGKISKVRSAKMLLFKPTAAVFGRSVNSAG